MDFKKFAGVAAAGAMIFALAGCAGQASTSSSSASEQSASASSSSSQASSSQGSSADSQGSTVTITSLDASGNATELEVPANPQRVAILDMASLDIIDNLGFGDSVVGSANTSLDYLKKYSENADVAALGTIKEADLEAVAACEPDVIFIGGRLASSYDALSEIAPVVYLATDAETGVVESTRANATQIAKIFGAEDKVDDLFADFGGRIDALKEVAAGQSAVIGMSTSGSFNLLGNDGRCSIIANEIGFDNIGAEAAAAMKEQKGGSSSQGGASANGNPHGNESSFETLVSLNPAYVFVMDRDSAINAEGAQLAQDIMNNDLVNGMQAAQDGKIVYLEHPAAWYTAEGGITALDYMLSDLEGALIK